MDIQMKLQIRYQDHAAFLDYEHLLRQSPCKECMSPATCTGCDKQAAWKQKLEALGIDVDSYIGLIKEYCQAFWDAYEANYAEVVAHRVAKEKQEAFNKIKEMVEVIK